ncbi:response regulator [Natrarchaeobius oligotrophus]|uniref:Response regulator n=1 Tax=Natrarchaeobius chitinivorans TaxID=1679083 RepID=A0A3N6MIF5_NATCH|nr:response regulator [Natrarchaeobius chitinivorans]
MTIMLVEDNPGDVRLTQEAFKTTNSDIEFLVVTNGSQAEESIRDCEDDESPDRPDMILLDLNLPGVDGFTILETLNESLEHPPPPVIVLSSSKTEADVTRCYELDANAYITKPDSPDEFDAIAQAVEDFWIDSAVRPPAPS